jgi:membrane protein
MYWRAVVGMYEHDGFGFASEMAYNALFSIFPGLLVLTAIVQRLGTADLVASLMRVAERYLPPQMTALVYDNLQRLLDRRLPGALTFGTILLLWTASNFLNVVIKALRVIYPAPDAGPATTPQMILAGARRRLLALALVILYGIATAVSFNVFVFGAQTARLLEDTYHWEHTLSGAFRVFRWPGAFLLMTLSTMLVYSVAPMPRLRLADAWRGALTFSVLWLLTTAVFSAYAMGFADYSRLYGAIAGIIMLMSWFYLSSLLLFFGAEVNAARLGGDDTSAHRSGRVPATGENATAE